MYKKLNFRNENAAKNFRQSSLTINTICWNKYASIRSILKALSTSEDITQKNRGKMNTIDVQKHRVLKKHTTNTLKMGRNNSWIKGSTASKKSESSLGISTRSKRTKFKLNKEKFLYWDIRHYRYWCIKTKLLAKKKVNMIASHIKEKLTFWWKVFNSFQSIIQQAASYPQWTMG